MDADIAERSLVKKTVVIHPIMDYFVRKTWSLLIDAGHDATYSVAVNFMLLAAIEEARKDSGLSPETRDTVWSFAEDRTTIDKLNLEDHLQQVKKGLWHGEMTS